MSVCDGTCASGDQHEPRVWPLAVSATLLVLGLAIEFGWMLTTMAQVPYVLAALVAGPDIFRNAWKSLLRRRLGMSFLMTLAAVGAFATGHGEEGAAVLLLFSVAEELEAYAATRAHSSIRSLLELAPAMAVVRRDGAEVQVPTEQVRVGETLVLRPGDKIPLDGVVVDGSSSVDQSPITGESVPVDKKGGCQVFAASMVNEGYLEVEVTQVSSGTLLARIVELVSEAEEKKAPTEQFVERFARVYTPAVVATAVVVAAVPPLLLGQPFMDWLYRALVLLVVSCPCALAISTPVSFVSGLTAAARQGVLIRGSEHLEAASRVGVVAFDKTGTLTRGVFDVVSVEVVGNADRRRVLAVGGAIEQRSQHPIAQAIVQYARAQKVPLPDVERFISEAGQGVSATVDGVPYRIGSPDSLGALRVELPEDRVQRLEQAGNTVVVLASSTDVLALFVVADRPRSKAGATVHQLRDYGLRTAMLTGDAQQTAEAVAATVDVDEVRAQLLPHEKVEAIRLWEESGDAVLMIGDGVNDAPALAQASVGVAMGAAGTDVAIETADIALMNDDLAKLPYLISLSRRTMATVRQNIALALSVKGTLALLSIPGWVSLWVAVAVGDMGLSLLVIANALRIGRVRRV